MSIEEGLSGPNPESDGQLPTRVSLVKKSVFMGNLPFTAFPNSEVLLNAQACAKGIEEEQEDFRQAFVDSHLAPCLNNLQMFPASLDHTTKMMPSEDFNPLTNPLRVARVQNQENVYLEVLADVSESSEAPFHNQTVLLPKILKWAHFYPSPNGVLEIVTNPDSQIEHQYFYQDPELMYLPMYERWAQADISHGIFLPRVPEQGYTQILNPYSASAVSAFVESKPSKTLRVIAVKPGSEDIETVNTFERDEEFNWQRVDTSIVGYNIEDIDVIVKRRPQDSLVSIWGMQDKGLITSISQDLVIPMGSEIDEYLPDKGFESFGKDRCQMGDLVLSSNLSLKRNGKFGQVWLKWRQDAVRKRGHELHEKRREVAKMLLGLEGDFIFQIRIPQTKDNHNRVFVSYKADGTLLDFRTANWSRFLENVHMASKADEPLNTHEQTLAKWVQLREVLKVLEMSET